MKNTKIWDLVPNLLLFLGLTASLPRKQTISWDYLPNLSKHTKKHDFHLFLSSFFFKKKHENSPFRAFFQTQTL